MRMTETELRGLIRETIAGSGMPWGGVREGDVWIPGQKTRAGTLTRKGDVSGKMSDLNLQLHGLYVDMGDLEWRSPEWNDKEAQIDAVKREIASLQRQHDDLARELERR